MGRRSIVGLVLRAVTFFISQRPYVWVPTITIFFALFCGITPAVAYRTARKNGEWPRDQV
ncbi:hypothetical protein [Motilibacter deserti]|uniref:Uncharacterized protein n=1 Tax=Motilibacter deserti TaxID=2714956 RepID=A0ABX0H1R9_9ACTN|nr:hypothetical protein [Motilibacter deserti]NHC15826.1 hypothetical protein [Motilibacter deserti]